MYKHNRLRTLFYCEFCGDILAGKLHS